MADPTSSLIACPDCDALQQAPAASGHAGAACWRCGALLVWHGEERVDTLFALSLGALALFLVVNTFPIIALDLRGNHSITTLFGTARALWNDNLELVAGLVLFTTVLVPGGMLVGLTYLTAVLSLRSRWDVGRLGAHALLHFVQWARMWSMLEVFLLGSIVSLVRLAALARVSVGPALYSCGALIVLFAILMSRFQPHVLWALLDEREVP